MPHLTPVSVPSHPNEGFLARAHKICFYLSILYAIGIAFLTIPAVQRHVIYQHAIQIPLFPQLDVPEKYGLAPGKTLNLKINTSDNITLGAWFILSDPFYQSTQSTPAPARVPEDTIREAVHVHPTILFFHGTAASRVSSWRVQHYATFTSRLRTNVLAIDYRGFADSTGVPSEAGLALDAHAAWSWLLDQGSKPEDILIVGHSLGTGVAAELAARLAQDGVKPRGVALLAPFTSFTSLTETYQLGGIPVLQPLQMFAFSRNLLKRLLQHEFNTLSRVQSINIPTFIAHCTDDSVIPHLHSRTLLDEMLSPFLPPAVLLPSAPGSMPSPEEFAAFSTAHAKRKEARSLLVRKVDIPNFGVVEEFDGEGGLVVYVETKWGGHDKVGVQEGVQDVMARTFRLGSN